MPRPPCPTEHEEQCAFIDWCELQVQMGRIEFELIFAIPNGGKRQKRVAEELRREGVKKGVPDLMFAYPCHGWPGLFIEMKRLYGSAFPDTQKEWRDRLISVGYAWVLAKGFDEARMAIENYLDGLWNS